MRLLLVRHGETEANRQGLALGRADVPLNERGLWQAQRLAQALHLEPIAAVYASPLQRALQTASPIAQRHGLAVAVAPDLIEMDVGEADGLTFAQVRERYPGLLDQWTSTDGPTTPMPGGERLLDVQQRAWSAIQSLRQRHPEETVAAVTHNFVILTILTHVLDLPLAQFRRLRHAVAAVTVLDLRDDRTIIVRLNDTCHLDEP